MSLLVRNAITGKLEVIDKSDYSMSGEGAFKFLSNKKYRLKNIDTGKGKTVKGDKVEKLINEGYKLESSKIKEGHLTSFAKGFAKEASFGLIKPRYSDNSEFANKEEFEEYQDAKRRGLSGGAGSVAGFFMGGPVGLGYKLAGKTLAKKGLPELGKIVKKLDINPLAVKAGKAIEKTVAKTGGNLGKIINKLKADKIAGKASEWAALSVPYAISNGLDNRDTNAIKQSLNAAAMTGAGFEIAKQSIKKVPFNKLKPLGGMIKKGSEKLSNELSTNFVQSYFNIVNSPEKIKDFAKIAEKNSDDIIRNLSNKNHNKWSKILGNKTDKIKKEDISLLNDEYKVKLIGDYIANKYPKISNDKFQLYNVLFNEIDTIGNKLSNLKKTLGKNFQTQVYHKVIKPKKVKYINVEKPFRDFLEKEIKKKYASHKYLSPEGKADIGKIHKLISVLNNQGVYAKKQEKFLQESHKKINSILGSIKNLTEKYKQDVRSIIGKDLQLNQKIMNKVVDKSSEKKFLADTIKKQSKFLLDQSNKNVGEINKRLEYLTRDRYKKLAKGEQHGARVLRDILKKDNSENWKKLQLARKDFNEKTLAKKYIDEFNVEKDKLNTVLKQYKDFIKTGTRVELGFGDLEDLKNLFKKLYTDKDFQNRPDLNKIVKVIDRMKDYRLNTDSKNYLEEINNLYSSLKTFTGNLSMTSSQMSSLQGAGAAQLGSQIGMSALGGAVGYGVGGPLLGAIAAIGGYNILPIMSKKGYGQLATAGFLTNMEQKIKNSSKMNFNDPLQLKQYMNHFDRIPIKKSIKPLTIKTLMNMLDFQDETENLSDMDLLSKIQQTIMEDDPNNFGTIDASYDYVQNINEEVNPELDAEKLLFKNKFKQVVNHFMPYEIKAMIKGEPMKPISGYKKAEFIDNVQTVMNPQKVIEKVKDGYISNKQAIAFKNFNPKEYRELIQKLLAIKHDISYSQNKALQTLLQQNGGFYLYESNPIDHTQSLQQNNPVKRMVKTREAELTPHQRGYA